MGPVTTAWRVLTLRIEERLPIWKVAANIYWINSSRQPTRGGPPAWGLGEVLTTTHGEKRNHIAKQSKNKPLTWTDTVMRPEQLDRVGSG